MEPTQQFMMPSPGRILSHLHPTPEKAKTLVHQQEEGGAPARRPSSTGGGVGRVLWDCAPGTAACGLAFSDCGHAPVPLGGEKNYAPPLPLHALRSQDDERYVRRRSVPTECTTVIIAPSPPSSTQSPAILRGKESAQERLFMSPFSTHGSSGSPALLGSGSCYSPPPAPARLSVNPCAISVNTSYWNVRYLSRRVPSSRFGGQSLETTSCKTSSYPIKEAPVADICTVRNGEDEAEPLRPGTNHKKPSAPTWSALTKRQQLEKGLRLSVTSSPDSVAAFIESDEGVLKAEEELQRNYHRAAAPAPAPAPPAPAPDPPSPAAAMAAAEVNMLRPSFLEGQLGDKMFQSDCTVTGRYPVWRIKLSFAPPEAFATAVRPPEEPSSSGTARIPFSGPQGSAAELLPPCGAVDVSVGGGIGGVGGVGVGVRIDERATSSTVAVHIKLRGQNFAALQVPNTDAVPGRLRRGGQQAAAPLFQTTPACYPQAQRRLPSRASKIEAITRLSGHRGDNTRGGSLASSSPASSAASRKPGHKNAPKRKTFDDNGNGNDNDDNQQRLLKRKAPRDGRTLSGKKAYAAKIAGRELAADSEFSPGRRALESCVAPERERWTARLDATLLAVVHRKHASGTTCEKCVASTIVGSCERAAEDILHSASKRYKTNTYQAPGSFFAKDVEEFSSVYEQAHEKVKEVIKNAKLKTPKVGANHFDEQAKAVHC